MAYSCQQTSERAQQREPDNIQDELWCDRRRVAPLQSLGIEDLDDYSFVQYSVSLPACLDYDDYGCSSGDELETLFPSNSATQLQCMTSSGRQSDDADMVEEVGIEEDFFGLLPLNEEYRQEDGNSVLATCSDESPNTKPDLGPPNNGGALPSSLTVSCGNGESCAVGILSGNRQLLGNGSPIRGAKLPDSCRTMDQRNAKPDDAFPHDSFSSIPKSRVSKSASLPEPVQPQKQCIRYYHQDHPVAGIDVRRNFVIVESKPECTIYKICIYFDRGNLTFCSRYFAQYLAPELRIEEFDTILNGLNSLDALERLRKAHRKFTMIKTSYTATYRCILGFFLTPFYFYFNSKCNTAKKKVASSVDKLLARFNSQFAEKKQNIVMKLISNGDVALLMKK